MNLFEEYAAEIKTTRKVFEENSFKLREDLNYSGYIRDDNEFKYFDDYYDKVYIYRQSLESCISNIVASVKKYSSNQESEELMEILVIDLLTFALKENLYESGDISQYVFDELDGVLSDKKKYFELMNSYLVNIYVEDSKPEDVLLDQALKINPRAIMPYYYKTLTIFKEMQDYEEPAPEGYVERDFTRHITNILNKAETLTLPKDLKTIKKLISKKIDELMAYIEELNTLLVDNLFKDEGDRKLIGIPSLIDWMKKEYELNRESFVDMLIIETTRRELTEKKKRKELEFKDKKLEEAIKHKNSIVSDFSHTYGNMKATGLYDIAKVLLKESDEEHKKLGRRLMMEYGIKQSLTREVYMMKLKFEQDAEKLKLLIRNSKLDYGEVDSDLEGSINVQDILADALKLCFLRVFYDSGDNDARKIRAQLKKLLPSLNELRSSFEEKVLFDVFNAISWMNENQFSINLEISGKWTRVLLAQDSYGVVFLRSLFSELLINILKYADKTKRIEIELNDDSRDKRYLAIETRNYIGESLNTDSGIGLVSKNEMLKLVNLEPNSDEDKDFISTIKNDNNEFITNISLISDLFV